METVLREYDSVLEGFKFDPQVARLRIVYDLLSFHQAILIRNNVLKL